MVQSSCSGSSFSPPSTQTGYASEQKSGWGESDANVRSLSESSCVLRSLWWGPQASFSSSGVPWTLSSAFPVSSHRSGAVARSYLFFRFFWHFLFFISFVFPPFVVSFLHDPYFTHSSIKMCVCVCVCGGGVSSGSLKREDFDPFLSSVCVQTLFCPATVFLFSSGLFQQIQI